MLLVNRLPVCEGVQQDEAVLQRRGLLVTILTLIFMSNGMMHEETLWRFLTKLGVHKDKKHECFGNVKKLVTEDFKRTGYLKTEVDSDFTFAMWSRASITANHPVTAVSI